MPTISIITAVYWPTSRYLDNTIDGVLNLKIPQDWELEWVIQEDGIEPKLEEKFKKVKFANYSSNKSQLGVAATRNLALERVSGEIVQLLDHDDILLEETLVKNIKVFNCYPSVMWVTGQADDLMEDGKRVKHPNVLPFGKIKAGDVYSYISEDSLRWPIHVAALSVKTDLLRAIGGWPAIPTSDDYSMFAALSEFADGFYIKDVTWLYRKYPEQQSQSSAWKKYSESGRSVITQRAKAIRSLGFR